MIKEIFMRTKLIVILGAVLLLVAATACNLTSLIPGGGSAGTVATLWPDVPPLEGATRENIDMPLPIRVAMQAMLQGKLEFVVYTTSAAPQVVKDFYTKDRMAAAGWDPERSAGCEFGSTEGAEAGGAEAEGAEAEGTEAEGAKTETATGNMCFFSKQESGREVGLVIMTVQDEKTKKTQIFYARVYGDVTPEPTK
jgi:hypothetical protein